MSPSTKSNDVPSPYQLQIVFFIVIINFSDTLAMPIIEVGGLKIGTGFS